ncbi:MAG: hypothetical protein VB084_14685 [Syntrophomonadaceae bacterium]|nr:hypothetical protein [Syntrophomonadaceae bacterium]
MNNLNNPTGPNRFNLIIAPEIWGDLEKRGILWEDVEKVVAHSQTTGQRFFNPEDSSYLANLRLDNVTCWVRYKEREDGVQIITVYSHRMAIVKE